MASASGTSVWRRIDSLAQTGVRGHEHHAARSPSEDALQIGPVVKNPLLRHADAHAATRRQIPSPKPPKVQAVQKEGTPASVADQTGPWKMMMPERLG
jgi:hypothetical protein